MAMIDPAMAYEEHAACQLKRGVLLRNPPGSFGGLHELPDERQSDDEPRRRA